MTSEITTLHHVTATVAEAQPDVDFYAGLLGLRLVKRTVNFDNHGVYHFYYGDALGRPSTLMTTFPYSGTGVREGVKGAGQITVTSLSVPRGSLGYWEDRFRVHDVAAHPGTPRFGASSLVVEDPSTLNIELVEAEDDDREPWTGAGVPVEAAIRGIHGVTLVVRDRAASVAFAGNLLGLRVDGEEGPRSRLATPVGGPGSWLEILESPHAPDAVNGLGTVHHVALAVPDEEAQARVRERLVASRVEVTPVRDRQYFRSIYFREPGGILYEVATEGPGFTLDEPAETLGTELRLPPGAQPKADEVAAALPPIHAPALAR